MPSLLITQCLQNDFVKPIGRFDALPNQLHVGYDEAMRLLGERVEEGAVQSVIDWAYQTPADQLALIHIRDWHDPDAPAQREHLQQFGQHCLRNTEGADFVFRSAMRNDRAHHIIDASGLNDFIDTDLDEVLKNYNGRRRVGLMGVWTEAKITFLAYDLATRYPDYEIGLCSALCASSSRSMHFVALEQLRSILGLQLFPSVAAFTEWLAGTAPALQRRSSSARLDVSRLEFENGDGVASADQQILLYLFRESAGAQLRRLDGGFSGNVVLKARATDRFGHKQAPYVIKIGARDPIAGERTAFERVQEVLGNSAPSIVDFAELEDRGAIKYRYAGMLDGDVRTLQKLYSDTNEDLPVFEVFDTVFLRQLGRFYDARSRESLNLLQYYDFSERYAPGVRRRVEALLGEPASSEELEILPGLQAPNVCLFYERDLPELKESYAAPHFTSYLHGDLNGANILVDASQNVWLIDFFHTHRGHILKDLIKLENDLLYIFTPLDGPDALRAGVDVVHALLDTEDLGAPPDPALDQRFKLPQLRRAYRMAARLRSYYPALIEADRDPYQLFVGVVRYAMHTLSFDECNEWQKKLALYAGCIAAARLRDSLRFARALRIDEIPLPAPAGAPPGRLGLTLLPGRKDRMRNLQLDLAAVLQAGYSDVLCLLTEDEFERYGVLELKEAYARAGIAVRYFPIPDQGAPRRDALLIELDELDRKLRAGRSALVHCVGGVGRSGLVAASYLLVKGGLQAEAAIECVRNSRSRRAVENRLQEDFVRSLAQ
ncbi:MAG: isochorismatase family protein [Leptospirales bacterium]|nr:isochorismatase family protein [Leptospirales bacterium]